MALSSGLGFSARYSNQPPGSNWGAECAISPSEASTFVSRIGVPPDSGTCINPFVLPNRILPSAAQAGAPGVVPAGQRATGVPPKRSVRHNLPFAVQPTDLPSGDQKGSPTRLLSALSTNNRSGDPSSGCSHTPLPPFTDAL